MKTRSPMKAVLKAALALLVLAGIAYLGWALYGQAGEEQDGLEVRAAFYDGEPGVVHVLENQHLRLELDGDTTFFTLTNKADGSQWRAVPEDGAKDPLALAGSKNLLQSTLALTYATDNGVRTLYDNYEYSIKNQVYEIRADEEQIRIDYTLGRITRAFLIPEVILVDRMDAFMAQLTKQQSRKMLDSYRKYDPARLKEAQLAELTEKYPRLAEGAVYALRDNVKDFLKEEFEWLLEGIGYSYEDYLQDQADAGTALSKKAAVFNLSLIYRLSGSDLLVEVPHDSIRYSSDYLPIRLNILPNFGAGSTDDTGFMLVPEGGGGIIRFNNGKTSQNGYFANVYGWDYATWRSAVVHETRARFPVFGVAKGGSAFLCMMEGQAANASLAAEVAGRGNSYNTVSASYNLLHYDAFNVTDRTTETIYMYEQGLPEGSITQRYRFLATQDLASLAGSYRDYLQERYPGLQPVQDRGLPLAVEIVGAIDKVQQRGGLPVSMPIRLTSFAEAAQIVEDLSRTNSASMHVRMSGAFNGGVRQKVLKQVKPVSQLGTAGELEQLAAGVRQVGARLYLGGITSFALDSGLTDGFLPLTDAARFTTRENVALYQYSNVWYGTREEDRPYYLLKPDLAVAMMQNLSAAAKRYGADGVAYEDAGSLLSADYNPRQTTSRDQVAAMQAAEMQKVQDGGQGILLRGGNLYALPQADLVTDTELLGVPYFILDEHVPFLHMALHGLVHYTGKPLNLSGDWEEELLLSAQRGAGLSFVFMAAEPLTLHDSGYSEYFGASYPLWADRAAEIIREYEASLGDLAHLRITGFEQLADGLSLTTYEDGSQVAVNFGLADQEVLGQAVKARSYKRLEGRGSK